MSITIMNNGGFKVAMTSLQVAELTGKEHKNIMADIKDESIKLGTEISQLIFQQSDYTNSRGKIYPMFNLSKDGAMQLGARYDAVTRFKMIQRINELENANPMANLTRKELLLLALEAEEKIERLEIENKEVKTENKEIKTAVVDIKCSLNNLEADVRVNINQAIRRLVDIYCKTNGIKGTDRECLYREIYQTVYTGFCKEYNVNFNDIKSKEYVSLKTGKPTKTKQSFIKIIESMGLQGLLADYIGSISPSELKMSI
ncbi:MAG: Rha family transcriptional regulator [Fusobacteriaceae bacterium]